MIAGKKGEYFPTAVLVILVIIILFITAFFTESRKTGMMIYGDGLSEIGMSDLASLSEGNYYIDNQGIIHWIDDSSRPAVAKIRPIREINTDRYLYVSDEGLVFYNG